MPTVYQPNDVILSPIIASIADIITNQISGVQVVYQQPPDGPPEDSSVLIPLSNYKILGDTNGKLLVQLTFGLRHYIRRGRFSENVLVAYSYFWPYMQAFSSWGNSQLGGLCQSLSISNGGVTQFVQAGTVYCVLVVNLTVLLEMNIPTS